MTNLDKFINKVVRESEINKYYIDGNTLIYWNGKDVLYRYYYYSPISEFGYIITSSSYLSLNLTESDFNRKFAKYWICRTLK